MKKQVFIFLTKLTITGAFFFIFSNAGAQELRFWDKVQFGGAAGAAFGSGYTDVTLAPSAIYRFNQYFAAGVGIQGSYVRQRDWFDRYIYGGSIITLANPIPQIQLSAELEQLRVNIDYDSDPGISPGTLPDRNFWNTALFLGAGYQIDRVTIGVRYNVLFHESDFVYSDAFMPFIRVYF